MSYDLENIAARVNTLGAKLLLKKAPGTGWQARCLFEGGEATPWSVRTAAGEAAFLALEAAEAYAVEAGT